MSTMNMNLHNAQLTIAFHAQQLARSLGHGGAKVDLSAARAEVFLLRTALDEIVVQLNAAQEAKAS